MHCHHDVILALGGKSVLARALGIEPKLATHWPRRGIPAKHWHRVEQIARAQGMRVTADDLAAWPARTEAA